MFVLASVTTLIISLAVPVLAQRRSPEARQKRQARIAARLDKRFKALDKDGSGAISRAEWPRAARAFERLDGNHDGQVTPDELRRRVARARRRR